MRRITNILLTTLAAGSLVACSDERIVTDTPGNDGAADGRAYMNLSVYVGDLPFGGTRAGETEEETTEGLNDDNVKEPRVEYINLLMRATGDDAPIDTREFNSANGTAEENLLIYETPYYKSKHAWEVKPMEYGFMAVANHKADFSRYPDDATKTPDIEPGDSNNYEAVTLDPITGKFVLKSTHEPVDDGYLMQPMLVQGEYSYMQRFAMISNAVQKTIIPGVTKEQAESPLFNPQLNNNVDFDLERVVAKASVIGPISMGLRLKGSYLGEFYFDYYTVSRMPDRFYALGGAKKNPPHAIFLNNGAYATDRNNRQNVPKGISSRIGDGDYLAGAARQYGFIGDDYFFDGYPFVYKVMGVQRPSTRLEHLYGVYLPENFRSDAAPLLWFNTSHFKVYGIFDPLPDKFVDAKVYADNAGKRPADWDRTFYFCKELNGFCYSLDNLTAEQKAYNWYKYTNGRGFYRTPVHVDPIDADFNEYGRPVKNADIERNHFYIVEIEGISDMPSNWDNVDPGTGGGTNASGMVKHGNSDHPSNLFRDETNKYVSQADDGGVLNYAPDFCTPEDYLANWQDVPNLKFDTKWGDDLYLAKPSDGKTDKPYDNIDENTPINSKRVTLRVRARVMRWNVQGFKGTIGQGDYTTTY